MASARGPAPKPRLTVVREGNPGHKAKAKLDTQIMLPPGTPVEPDWSALFDAAIASRIVRDAAAEWRRIVPMLDAQGLLAVVDTGLVIDHCIVFARLRSVERSLTDEGLTVVTERGIVKNPLASIANAYRGQLRYSQRELFLTPAARARGGNGSAKGGGGDSGSPWSV